jgi:CRP/FNR family transcriptional regulator, cyclic AMP receptor protein
MTALHEDLHLIEAGTRSRVGAGATIFEVGDPVVFVHVIISGVVLIRSTSLDGEPAVVDVRATGDLLDDTALLAESPAFHLDQARSVTDCEVWRVALDRFDELRDRRPDVGVAVMAQLSEQARRLSGSLIDLLGRPARSRTARRLLDLDEALERSQLRGTPLDLTQQELADYVGTTRSTLNAMLGELSAAGALRRQRGRLTIVDGAALAQFA